jgi:orotidine-5'-phosphate decarboxylase
MRKTPPIIVALDHATDQEALSYLDRLDPSLCRVKIGSILFTHYGPSLLEKIRHRGFDIFLDLKFHDIPQTVAGACLAAAEMGVWMVNLHIAGGLSMMTAAREALAQFPISKRPLLIGVTILTSLDESDLAMIGYSGDAASMVLRFAQLAHRAGLDGVVCSAQEATVLRSQLPKDFLLVTPGIRLPNDPAGDQKRIMTPAAAFAAGADYLVIGRSLTQSKNPQQILSEIELALAVAEARQDYKAGRYVVEPVEEHVQRMTRKSKKF